MSLSQSEIKALEMADDYSWERLGYKDKDDKVHL
jgi:hypothetical protein